MGKKILIINPGTLFPPVMMSQNRTINLIKWLSKDHVVDIAIYVRNNEELLETQRNLKNICRNIYPIQAVNPTNHFFKRKLYGIISVIARFLFGYPREVVYYRNNKSLRKIQKTINDYDYDVVQVEYWYLAFIFKKVKTSICKIIDTHGLIYVKKGLLKSKKEGGIRFLENRAVEKYTKLEHQYLKYADIIISNSKKDYETLVQHFPDKKNILISNGQNIEYFYQYNKNVTVHNHTILFYGSYGGNNNQNTIAFFRFWNKILPIIKEEVPEVKVLIVGSNPSESMKKLDDGLDVIVTGFVHDVRQYLSTAHVMILPLEIGSGFRGRIIEVMAMGVPVIGTHNALDSIEMTSGVHGYVTDNDNEMAEKAVQLLNDSGLRKYMSEECRRFVAEKYTIEATYGKLSKYYMDLDPK